eukprot:CAMPEP_0113661304 /NCGR_PEP_ID=MMETSP0017_2-20120614/33356_1 /TAXON_ID=2856 /ORGANISM="Cylindrotheca closterium" /LENGTH=228 /DNA_ID=CAMNT_0000575985 /DNA_START=120 /DNA_END=808 /DNA_ORIENTATION=- /assembly_acc=CAM_ASM_000147
MDHQQQPQAKEAAAKSWILPFRHVRYGCHSNHHYYYQSLQMPHILLLDEPTTNLDIETICVMLSTSSMEDIVSADKKKKSPPKVELVGLDTVRLHLSYSFRLAAPRLLPEKIDPTANSNGATGTGLPLKIELVSDYKLDPNSGQVTVHKLVETRVNGQPTPGDVLSRWIQRFLKLDNEGSSSGATGTGLPLKIELVSDYKLDPNSGHVTVHKLVETRVSLDSALFEAG